MGKRVKAYLAAKKAEATAEGATQESVDQYNLELANFQAAGIRKAKKSIFSKLPTPPKMPFAEKGIVRALNPVYSAAILLKQQGTAISEKNGWLGGREALREFHISTFEPLSKNAKMIKKANFGEGADITRAAPVGSELYNATLKEGQQSAAIGTLFIGSGIVKSVLGGATSAVSNADTRLSTEPAQFYEQPEPGIFESVSDNFLSIFSDFFNPTESKSTGVLERINDL